MRRDRSETNAGEIAVEHDLEVEIDVGAIVTDVIHDTISVVFKNGPRIVGLKSLIQRKKNVPQREC